MKCLIELFGCVYWIVARENNGEHDFLAQASTSRLGKTSRGSPRFPARDVA